MSLRIFLILVITAFLSASCSNSSNENVVVNQDSVFSEDSMKTLMIDFYLTEAVIRQIERDGKDVPYYTNHYYDLLLQKYHSDTLKILRSYKFWSAHPVKLKELSVKALDSLVITETLLQSSND